MHLYLARVYVQKQTACEMVADNTHRHWCTLFKWQLKLVDVNLPMSGNLHWCLPWRAMPNSGFLPTSWMWRPLSRTQWGHWIYIDLEVHVLSVLHHSYNINSVVLYHRIRRELKPGQAWHTGTSQGQQLAWDESAGWSFGCNTLCAQSHYKYQCLYKTPRIGWVFYFIELERS